MIRTPLAATGIAVFLSACQSTSSQDTAVRVFNQLAFLGTPGGHPVSTWVMLESDYENHKIYRWEKQIYAYVGDANGDHQVATARRILKEVGSIAGREITFAGANLANFKYTFVDTANLIINGSEFSACAAHVERNETDGIKSVEISVAMRSEIPLEKCLYHETLHGFGLAHTSLVPSILNYASRTETLTYWDTLILKTMYGSDIRTGMNRAQSLPKIRRTILANRG